MKLSENFTLEELLVTNTGLPNIPSSGQIENLQQLVKHVLQPLRNDFGRAIRVNSGFRSVQVNQRVGGSATSSHCNGEAADLSSDDNADLFRIIREKLSFDQLIWEAGNDRQPSWVHVSYRNADNRQQVLRMINGKYQKIS